MSKRKKLLLSVAEVAELTDLPLDFWTFVAEQERDWDIERFFYAAGSYRIAPYYLKAYLLEDLEVYYRTYEKAVYSGQSAASFGNNGENFSEIKSSVQ